MRLAVAAPLIAAVGFAGARFARVEAHAMSHAAAVDPPYAPGPDAAPIVALGYRELAADLMLVRLIGYFGTPGNDAGHLADLAEATVALDPTLRRTYELGAIAMTSTPGTDNAIRMRAIRLLGTAGERFPSDYKYPRLAGEIYLVDLQPANDAERRAWQEAGSRLLEDASRKPGAPAQSALAAASLQSRLGQHQRAVDNLREILLVTTDEGARAQLIAKLAELTNADSAELAAEVLAEREEFVKRWQAERPAVKASLYVLLGPPLPKTFDLTDLATGGHDLVGSEPFEKLDPVTDPPVPPSLR